MIKPEVLKAGVAEISKKMLEGAIELGSDIAEQIKEKLVSMADANGMIAVTDVQNFDVVEWVEAEMRKALDVQKT